ncbi:MAG: glycosyltransferase family 2 protein [bacterium]|nr:glycosyltransferase family 2 protein [bacterium]
MNANPSISLIFVNYRSARYLAVALESLFSFERSTDFFEIIVVNNDPSESATLQSLQQATPFFLIENNENSGFSRAGNLGAKQAKGELLGFINPDVLWMGASLRKIAHVFGEDSQAGVLGMMLLDEKKRPEVWSAGPDPSLVALLLNNLFPLRKKFSAEKKAFSVVWVSGGALFIRRGLFADIGDFDERFFLYFEDVDLCKAVRKLGFSVVCHPEFPLIHLGGKSQESKRLQKKHYYDSQEKYFEKHRPAWERIVLKFFHFFFCKRQL